MYSVSAQNTQRFECSGRGEISSIFTLRATFTYSGIQNYLCTSRKCEYVPELSALSEGGGVISLEGDREWRPTMEERGDNDCMETLHCCYGDLQSNNIERDKSANILY